MEGFANFIGAQKNINCATSAYVRSSPSLAFWLRSSVVSVLYKLTLVTPPSGRISVNHLFRRGEQYAGLLALLQLVLGTTLPPRDEHRITGLEPVHFFMTDSAYVIRLGLCYRGCELNVTMQHIGFNPTLYYTVKTRVCGC